MLTRPRGAFALPHGLSALACACLLLACAHAPARAQRRSRMSVEDVGRADQMIWEGRRLVGRGDARGAVEVLRRAAEQFTDYSDGWYWLGLALRRAGDLDESGRALARALKLRGDSATVRAEMAYTLMLAGKRGEAAKQARRAFGVEGPKGEPHYLFGVLHLSHEFAEPDAPARALAEADAAISADAGFARAHLLKAQALTRLAARSLPEDRAAAGRQLAEAAASLERFLALAPADGEHALWQGQLAALRGHGEALAAPETARTIFTPKELTTRAQVISRPEPLYTEEARRTQTFGTVRVRLVLAADGSVQHVVALTALPNGLTERAVEAARSVQFRPATKDGRPVSQFVTIEYNFHVY